MRSMSKTEIIAELTQLSPEDLADVRSWLDRLMLKKSMSAGAHSRVAAPRIRSPRLANPARSVDFIKHVTELPADARL
jgi:hypothetical protein